MCVTEWQRELTAIGAGVWVLSMGAIVFTHVKTIYYPRPTRKSAETIRHLTATIERLRAENLELRTEVLTQQASVRKLSSQLQRLQRSLGLEPLP